MRTYQIIRREYDNGLATTIAANVIEKDLRMEIISIHPSTVEHGAYEVWIRQYMNEDLSCVDFDIFMSMDKVIEKEITKMGDV